MMRYAYFKASFVAAGLLLTALAFAPIAIAGGNAKPDAGCTAHRIVAVIQGCTAVIDNGGHKSKAKLAQAYLNRGKALAKRGSYAAAIADFGHAIDLNPKNAEAYRSRGVCHWELRDRERTESDLAAAIRLNPGDAINYAARGWYYKANGEDAHAKADFEQAIVLADKAIAAKKDLAKAHYGRAEALGGLGDYSGAIAADDEAIKLNPDNESAYSDRGFVYSLKGDKERALADENKALELQPEYWRALRDRATLFVQQKNYARAIADCDLAIALSKDNPQAYNCRGYAYQQKGDFDRAVADLSEAIRLSPKFADPYSNRGWAYIGKKDFDRAIADFTAVIDLYPKLAGGYLGRGRAYLGKKDFPHAIADFDAVIGIDSGAWNHIHRGTAYQEMGEQAKALADFNEAIRLDPDNWLAYSVRAGIYSDRHDYDKEIADRKEVVRLQPEASQHYILLAQAYENKDDHDRAIAELDKLLKRQPDSYEGYKSRGYFHIFAYEYDEALADAAEMIRLKPDNREGYRLRASAYIYKKDYDRAIADATQAIRLDPDHANSEYFFRANLYNLKGDYTHAVADATGFIMAERAETERPNIPLRQRQLHLSFLLKGYNLRGMYRVNMGDSENALADYNEAIKVLPDSSEGYTGRAQFYYWRQQYDLAIQDLDKALQLKPDDTTARATKAMTLLRLGRIDEASAEADIGLRSGQRYFFLAVRGAIALEQKKFAAAVDDFTEAMKGLQIAKGFAWYYMHRGLAYEKLGQKALAMADYKTAIGFDAADPTEREARVEARERLSALEGEMLSAQQPAQAQPAAAAPSRRVALVIGIGAYDNAPRLRNPASDAAAMAAKLRELGFAEVVEVSDPTRADLEAALMAFGDKAADADWALVFYAGHGMQVDGRNFLIPKDAKLDSDRHVDFETVVLDRVLESASGAKKLSLVILDACRNNPFLKRMRQTRGTRSFGQGLAAVDPVQGQMIVYATKDGSVANDGEGEHSPFTEALLAHIAETHLDIRLMFSKVRDTVMQNTQNKQQPFTYGSLPGEGLFFKLTEK
jgi:tetratricopeptide (TPR) repeat protein